MECCGRALTQAQHAALRECYASALPAPVATLPLRQLAGLVGGW